ncbi:GntR family transcriptional regulator [Phytoactinopolyspora mesophila]|uniref:GntR family transcriptional regulator n=1 Tax=Phytoactinopolyspora mesophila TaxID=2650750 RepID=A0A7K3M0W8_9ACTN|nr:GntR family transcriptional regulator [Phytoactinopolyspora mesophila]NDL56936.1 GntR family transcriptional regulator [Phytoactinopolyspora mesophila]
MTRPPRADRPLYTRIATALKGRILSGSLTPGSRLPGEEHLAANMGVSRSTVRQAIAALRESGYVVSRRGSGSYVAENPPVEPLSVRSGPVYTGFLEDLADESQHVDELQRAREEISATPPVAADLRIPVGSPVVRFDAVRRRHGVVYGVASDILPFHIAEHITSDVLERSATIGDALAKVGHRSEENLQRVEPALLGDADARLCGVQPGSPALVLTGVAYDGTHTPIDSYTLTIISGYGIGLSLTRASRPDIT